MHSLINNVVSLAIFLAGLIFFIYSFKRVKTGIGYKDFISSRYMYCKINTGYGIKRNMILRKLSIADIIEIGDVPNWINTIFIEKDIDKLLADTKKTLEKKSEEELLKQTTQYYNFLQKVAEKSIVRWDEFINEWRKVDPQFNPRLDDSTLQEIFSKQIESVRGIVKKKNFYNELRLLGKNMEKRRANI